MSRDVNITEETQLAIYATNLYTTSLNQCYEVAAKRSSKLVFLVSLILHMYIWHDRTIVILIHAIVCALPK